MSDGKSRATPTLSTDDRHRIPRFPVVRGRRAPTVVRGPSFALTDLYHWLLTMAWSRFFVGLAIIFFAFNFLFGAAYFAMPGSIANAHPDSFSDDFFFSVQTMATIGYGDMHPATFSANLVVTAEVLLAVTGLACATGLIFARFSRPTARVMFSEVAVVARHNGVPTLMFRSANQRRNRILEAVVNLMLVRNEMTAEGEVMRRFYDLKVVRQRNPTFVLTWTVMHPIDDSSPLKGATRQTLKDSEGEIVATIFGTDESFGQTIHARYSYDSEHIRWGKRLADIIGRTTEGALTVDYAKFHDVIGEDS